MAFSNRSGRPSKDDPLNFFNGGQKVFFCLTLKDIFKCLRIFFKKVSLEEPKLFHAHHCIPAVLEGFRVSIEKGGCEIFNLFKAGCRAAFVFTEECRDRLSARPTISIFGSLEKS